MSRFRQIVALVALVAVLAFPVMGAAGICGKCMPSATPVVQQSMPCCPESNGTGDRTCDNMTATATMTNCCNVQATPSDPIYAPAPPATVAPATISTTTIANTPRPTFAMVEARAHASPVLAVLCSFLI